MFGLNIFRRNNESHIGEEMDDGTIFAGYCEGRPLYVTLHDAPGSYTFEKAVTYAKNLEAHGHHDFHMPNENELEVLWQNRNKGKLKGTFNKTGVEPSGWYWSSSSRNSYGGQVQSFKAGRHAYYPFSGTASLRCVR